MVQKVDQITNGQWVKQQITENFDTGVLALCFLGSITLVLHIAHHDMDKTLVTWAQGIVSAFSGALLLRLNRRTETKSSNQDQQKNQQQVATPVVPTV